MSAAWEYALPATLAVLLAVVSGVAGALWFRVRSQPVLRATHLARDLVERLRVLEQLINRLEKAEKELKSRPGATNPVPSPPVAPGPRPTPPESSEAPMAPPTRPAERIPLHPGAAAPPPHAKPAPSPTLRREDPPIAAPTGPTLIAVPILSTPSAEPHSGDLDGNARHGAIWKLADQGMTAEKIARETGLPPGQIELILGLRRRAQPAARGD